MKAKHSKLLLISAILGSIYAIYLIVYFGGGIAESKDAAEAAGRAIATALVTPHMILVALAVIFNWIGYFSNKRGFALTGGILYSVAGVIFILYLIFLVPSIILSFVGYAKLKKVVEINNTNQADNNIS